MDNFTDSAPDLEDIRNIEPRAKQTGSTFSPMGEIKRSTVQNPLYEGYTFNRDKRQI